MTYENKKSNHLINEKSPYLLQHAYNPVNWYPWCDEAFSKAKSENKSILLSIGYSTCHWCHVMAHESFEDQETAKILNNSFISIKVDKEERPDIDSIYMSVCQALTGSGGWPTSIFMTPEQKPFFAGTYFPRERVYGSISFKELLNAIKEKWESDKEELLMSANEIVDVINKNSTSTGEADMELIKSAVSAYKYSFDKKYGGFGDAPKFPSPHNLLFLLNQYEKNEDKQCLEMVEKTLIQMYKGGIFDHIGFGFSRYSTDKFFLVPHFEKMLYDNALLIMAYCKTYEVTKNTIYMEIAKKSALYIINEMTFDEGGFYCAQDADSEGEEGKYYVFKPSEINKILGDVAGGKFNSYYNITENGNFEGKSIPNLLKSDIYHNECEDYLQEIYKYRKQRYKLHLDDKILTSWNSLMIVAMCYLYRISKDDVYLKTAVKAKDFIEDKLCENDTLYVSYRDGKRGTMGFLEDYANYIYAQLALYGATLDNDYLFRAIKLCKKVIIDFWDDEQNGFYLYGDENETLIMNPKETYDGAMPSGNSVMAYNLVHLYLLTDDEDIGEVQKKQLGFLSSQAKHYPAGYSMFLTALSDYFEPPEKIVVVKKDDERIKDIPFKTRLESVVRVISKDNDEYPLVNDRTTYYVCKNHSCRPPVNEL